jgi:hypothetical protein
MGTIDSYRCKELYTQILEKFHLDKRLNTELINYGREKKINVAKEIKKNIHFITMLKSEEIYSLRDMKGYQLTIKENNAILPIKNERKSIEKEINFLRRKVDRFRIWKKELSNMKEIVDELDLENTQYAIQLKENNYLLWKFKKRNGG